jgi:hypothetical protein
MELMGEVSLGITMDCADARVLSRFWALALSYEEAPPPEGWTSWAEFLTDHGVPEDEWGDGATIRPANGAGPTISFLKVPEPKVAKNRVHLDVKVSGGRHVDPQTRERRIRTKEAELVAAGGATLREDRVDGNLDHVVMADPEGNEFCVV